MPGPSLQAGRRITSCNWVPVPDTTGVGKREGDGE
eukprot:CAMPEP_0168455522 /NCGR_PEP_ID=MMETSP0228-20121227/50794_1 /TAXON_ID=133427 /ORGANISM="Protoceratium reticulatum, Strain CCCM 535 (=CCMP 1889)" /LENGTH=34 /DNA_ID= /DNA_START= /DNA_END= /DNA_ORIENTATION=